VHLAHRDDEEAVLREFAAQSEQTGFECSWISREEVLDKSQGVNPDRLLGGLFSPSELCVNPREAIRKLTGWLASDYNVELEFGKTITGIDDDQVTAADGRCWRFDRALVCCGVDFRTLFPELFRDAGLRVCKLQMLRTIAQPNEWRLGPHLAGGLTLRHYPTFEGCPTLPQLVNRIANQTPELDRLGIHVMAAQNDAGEVILGDSHEYDTEIEPFNKSEIDDLILRELRKIIRLSDWTIAERWYGVYSKNPAEICFEAEPIPNVHIFNGLGGAGMTMSFGLAERFWLDR
jgi:FAD dependent oxidoreductase TIGR03364